MNKKNIYLFQPQYAIETRKENNYWIPYSVGCLWSYAMQFKDLQDTFDLKHIGFRREPPDQVLEKMQNPVLCGFSCYVWNEQYCLVLAEKIKQRWPECVIMFGGPQASGSMIKHSFIDSIVMSEGEESFVEALQRIINQQPPEAFYNKKRLQNLDIPSPYSLGVFDQIIKDNPDAIWSIVIETNRGCPFSCTFCDWGGMTYSKIKKFDLEKIKQELDWCLTRPIAYIFVADANFGVFKERDIEIAKMIKELANKSMLETVNIQYAKNSSEVVFEINKILGDLTRGITISVQSMHEPTLDAVKRTNLDINNIKHLMDLSEKYNAPTYTELILGMPLETLESWKNGFNDLLEAGQHNMIDIWFTQLLENSEMAQLSSRQKYGIKSVIAKDYMPLYNPNDWRDIEEEIELVNATTTMTTQDMVECYMYGWMILHFHCSGYSQLLAKYCRRIKNISYRKFYDTLFEFLQKENFFQDNYQMIQNLTSEYLHRGTISKFDNTQSGHNLHSMSYEFIYKNKDKAYKLVQQMVESLCELDTSIRHLQENFIFDKNQQYPVMVHAEFELESGANKPTLYRLDSRIKSDEHFNFYRYRRQGLTKNKIVNLS
jgi:radical SAM superfamily enzyme YgiQ (UPF0313 family)